MSPTAEQTEERSQHDEEDGSKRSLRRFSIVVQRLHWKVLYLHRRVRHLGSTLIYIKYFYFSLRLLWNQVRYLSILIFTFRFSNEDTGAQATQKYLQSSCLPMNTIQVKELVKPFIYFKNKNQRHIVCICSHKIHGKVPQLCSCQVSNVFGKC